MKELEDLYSGFTRTLSFVPNRRDKKPYDSEGSARRMPGEEKSKDKRKHKDYSKAREKKRNWE